MKLFLPLLCAVAANGLVTACLAVEAGPELIRPALAEALTNHPALLASGARVSSARSATEAVRTWQDPVGSVGVMPAPRNMRRDNGDIRYGLELPLPLNGKAGASREAVRAEVVVRESELAMRRFMLEREISRGFIALALADELLETARSQETNAATVAQLIESQIAVGRADAASGIRAGAELARRRATASAGAVEREAAARSLNILLRREPATAFPKLELPASLGALRPAESLALMSDSEPGHLMLMNEERRASLAAAATRKSRRPDFALLLEMDQYSSDGEPKQGLIALKMSLPWFNRSKYSAELDRDVSAAEAARQDHIAQLVEVRSRLTMLHGEAAAAAREAEALRKEVMPRAYQSYEAARATWQSGTGAFRDVLEADRMRGEARVDHARAVGRYWSALYELLPLTGAKDINSLMAGSTPPSNP